MIELNQLEIISGFSSLIGLIIAFILGFTMINKYFKYKDRNLLLMGLVIILASQAWWPYSVTFILFFARAEPLTLQMYLIIGLSLQVITLFIGNYVMISLISKDKVKLVMVLTAIYGALFQTVLFYAMFIDPEMFATLEGDLDVRYKSWLALFLLFNIILILIFAILLLRESRKSPEPQIRLKGLLYLTSILSYTIGAILDVNLPLSLLLLVIVRTLLTISSFGIYLAFAMPEWAKKIFLRKKQRK